MAAFLTVEVLARPKFEVSASAFRFLACYSRRSRGGLAVMGLIELGCHDGFSLLGVTTFRPPPFAPTMPGVVNLLLSLHCRVPG